MKGDDRKARMPQESTRGMSFDCPMCSQPLTEIRYPSDSMLNRDQWESQQAGDLFCTCHNNHRGNKPYAYFWKSELSSLECGQAGRDAELLRIVDDPATIFYGPHECPNGCGRQVCRVSLEQGGMMFEYPEGIIYPNTNWVQHVCEEK